MRYKIIAFDMDGTMLNDDKLIPPENLAAIGKAAERGCHIVPATGRMVYGMPKEIRQLPFVRYYISMNGALLWDEQEQKVLCSNEMEAEDVISLFEYLDGFPVGYDCYRGGLGYISEDVFSRLEEYFADIPQMIGYVKSIRKKVPQLKESVKLWGESIQKIQIYFRPEHEPLRQELLKKLPGLFPQFCFTTSLKNNIEVNSLGAGKDKALRALCGVLGIDISETLAFGDGSNDSAMLAAAGLGVCMENGCDEAKAAADIIGRSNNEAGLAIIVEELMEKNQI